MNDLLNLSVLTRESSYSCPLCLSNLLFSGISSSNALSSVDVILFHSCCESSIIHTKVVFSIYSVAYNQYNKSDIFTFYMNTSTYKPSKRTLYFPTPYILPRALVLRHS